MSVHMCPRGRAGLGGEKLINVLEATILLLVKCYKSKRYPCLGMFYYMNMSCAGDQQKKLLIALHEVFLEWQPCHYYAETFI